MKKECKFLKRLESFFGNKENKFHKVMNRICVPFATIAIIVIAAWVVAMVITGGKWYYRWQFEKNETAPKLTYTVRSTGEVISYDEEDLEVIMNQMVDFLMNREESMQVTIDGKTVFSNQALIHMTDVRDLYNRWTVITAILIVLLGLVIIYMYYNFDEIKKRLRKQTLIVYAVIGGLLLIVGVAMIINFDWSFTMFHHILFPNPDKFEDAFFGSVSHYDEMPWIRNQLLIEILSIEVFMDAAWIILTFLVIVIALWTIIAFKKGDKIKKQEEINIANN